MLQQVEYVFFLCWCDVINMYIDVDPDVVIDVNVKADVDVDVVLDVDVAFGWWLILSTHFLWLWVKLHWT